MNDKTGGPAFPVRGDDARWGLSMRDYFAAKAMQAHCQALSDARIDDWHTTVANLAYATADAMIKAREAK